MKRKFHKDYDLTKISDRKKYIDAINKRIIATAEAFGEDSLVFKKMITNIKQMFYDRSILVTEREVKETRINDKGKKEIVYRINEEGEKEPVIRKEKVFPHLSRSKEFMEKDSTFDILNKQEYLNKPTLNEYLQKTLEKMKERGEIDEYVKLNQQLQGPPTIEGKYPTIKNQVIEYTIKVAELSDDIREDYAFLYGHEDDAEIQDALNTLQIKGRKKTYEELVEIKKAIAKAKSLENYDENDPYKDF